MKENAILGPHDRPSLKRWIPLSFQHVFAMFGATVLVPLLTGFSPSTALFTAGTGTLIYILCTGAKVPAFLGSSFAFIPALIGISQAYGQAYALGGAICAGLFYAIVAGSIKVSGSGWIDKVLPPRYRLSYYCYRAQSCPHGNEFCYVRPKWQLFLSVFIHRLCNALYRNYSKHFL